MNIDCTKWRELASDYIEGTLPPDMKQAVTVHLRGCQSCRLDESTLRAIGRELNVLPEVDPPLFFRENVMSTIERSAKRPIGGAWWQSIWSGYGRLVIGASLTVSVATAVTFAVLSPRFDHASGNARQIASLTNAEIVSSSSSPSTSTHFPDLHLARVTTVLPGEGVAWDFAFNLENATSGTARIKVAGIDTDYRFQLTGTTQQTLRIPASVLAGRKSLDLKVDWTADQVSHNRQVFLPVTTEGEPVADVRQSFGLPESALSDMAREIATRYRQPIIIDDAVGDPMVRLTARDETAEETLRRQLADLGMTVTAANDGIHIRRTDGTATGK